MMEGLAADQRKELRVTSSWVFWTVIISLSAFMWFLPTVTALIRYVHGLHIVIMVNVLCLIMPLPGWFAAMYAAFAMPKRLPPSRLGISDPKDVVYAAASRNWRRPSASDTRFRLGGQGRFRRG